MILENRSANRGKLNIDRMQFIKTISKSNRYDLIVLILYCVSIIRLHNFNCCTGFFFFFPMSNAVIHRKMHIYVMNVLQLLLLQLLFKIYLLTTIVCIFLFSFTHRDYLMDDSRWKLNEKAKHGCGKSNDTEISGNFRSLCID